MVTTEQSEREYLYNVWCNLPGGAADYYTAHIEWLEPLTSTRFGQKYAGVPHLLESLLALEIIEKEGPGRYRRAAEFPLPEEAPVSDADAEALELLRRPAVQTELQRLIRHELAAARLPIHETSRETRDE